MAGGLPPQMMQMLAAGGAPGGGGQPPPSAPPAAAAIGRMLQGQRTMKGGSGEMETKILEQCMVQVGKVLQTIMMSNPKAYQTLLKAQMSLHSSIQQLKEGAQEDQEHAQMTSSIMSLLNSAPGGAMATGGAGPVGNGPQLPPG